MVIVTFGEGPDIWLQNAVFGAVLDEIPEDADDPLEPKGYLEAGKAMGMVDFSAKEPDLATAMARALVGGVHRLIPKLEAGEMPAGYEMSIDRLQELARATADFIG